MNYDGAEIVEIINDELIRTESIYYGTQLWGLCKLKKHKQGEECYICGGKIGTSGYRPLTNLNNRFRRICADCGKK